MSGFIKHLINYKLYIQKLPQCINLYGVFLQLQIHLIDKFSGGSPY